MESIDNRRNPLCIAWEAWSASKEGQELLELTQRLTMRDYLETRLAEVFQAGWFAAINRVSECEFLEIRDEPKDGE